MRANEITEDGYYWWRQVADAPWQIALVTITPPGEPGFSLLTEHDHWEPLYNHYNDEIAGGEFAGPLVPPDVTPAGLLHMPSRG